MKNLTKLFLSLLLVGIVFTGCQEAEELLDVKFDVDYETELDVTVVPETKAVNGVFSFSETIDPNSNSEYAEYASTIKGFDVNEISGRITYINPNVTLVIGNLTIFNENHSATWTFENEELAVETVLTLDNNTGQWDIVEEILMDTAEFTVTLDGETVEDNAEFTVLIKLNGVVIANPLD